MDREAIIEQLRAIFAGTGDRIAAAYLFGSVARDEAGPESDVDVGVLLRGGVPRTLADYPFQLEDEFARRNLPPVDVVVMNGAAPDLLHRILRDGILVAEHDRGQRIEFEIKARNDYWDVLPYIEHYRRSAIDSA